MDHRRVQRALFRMQLDPRFAARVRAREAEALRSAGLAGDELELLAGADAAAVSADRGGKRRAQFLRNVTSEFALSLALASDSKLVEGFTASREFHEAVSRDASLPLAFADHLVAQPGVHGVAALEHAMARARRAPLDARGVPPGHVALAPGVSVIQLAKGTLEAAARVRAALDRGEPIRKQLEVKGPPFESLLLRREREPAPFRLPAVEVEGVTPALGEMLTRAERPRPRAELASDAELAEVVDELLADGILVAG
jgi:hypothetical protein